MVALFMAAPPLAGIFGGPLSGWIMQSFSGSGRTRRMAVAVPARGHSRASSSGFVVLVYLDNGIRSARWLNDARRSLLEERIAQDRTTTVAAHPSLAARLRDRRLVAACA